MTLSPGCFADLGERARTFRPRSASVTLAAAKIKQTLQAQGPATAIVLTDGQVDELGGGKRAAVTVTIGKTTARLRLAVMGGKI